MISKDGLQIYSREWNLVRQFSSNVACICLVFINTTTLHMIKQVHMKHIVYTIPSNHGIFSLRLFLMFAKNNYYQCSQGACLFNNTWTLQLSTLSSFCCVQSCWCIPTKYSYIHFIVEILDSHLVAQHLPDLGYTLDPFLGMLCFF